MLDLTGKRIERFFQIWIPVLTVVVGAIWALYGYWDHQKEAQRLLAVEARKDANIRAVESRKPFLEKQLQLYFETSQLVDGWSPLLRMTRLGRLSRPGTGCSTGVSLRWSRMEASNPPWSSLGIA
jgi:hypothetical protein